MGTSEGIEYSLSDRRAWRSLALRRGQVIEVHLPSTDGSFPPDLWAGFLAMEPVLPEEGESGFSVEVKSLGCSDPDTTKWLSSAFNRRRGTLHFCEGTPCFTVTEHTLHVTRVRVFSAEAFTRNYMSHATLRQMKKWLGTEEGETAGEPYREATAPNEESPGWLDAPRKEPTDAEVEAGEKAEADAAAVKEPAKEPEKTKERKERRRDAERADRRLLRQRLDKVRERICLGGAGAGNAGLGAGHPPPGEAVCVESSSEGYSASEPLEDLVKKERFPPLPPPGALALAALPVPGGEVARGKDKDKQSKRRKKKKERQKAAAVKGALAIRDGTTSNLQSQLLAKAAAVAKQQADQRKEKAKKQEKKDPGKQLAKILTEAMQGKKKKRKKGREETSEEKNKKSEERRQEEEKEGWISGRLRPQRQQWEWVQQLSCEELREGLGRLFEGLGPKFIGGGSDGATIEEKIHEEAGLSAPLVSGSCQEAAGSDLQADTRNRRRKRSHSRDTVGHLFRHSAQASIDQQCPDQGTPSAGQRAGYAPCGTVGRDGGPISGAIHVATSSINRWQLDGGEVPRVDATGGRERRWKRSGLTGEEACQDLCKGDGRRQWHLARFRPWPRKQRKRRMESKRRLGSRRQEQGQKKRQGPRKRKALEQGTRTGRFRGSAEAQGDGARKVRRLEKQDPLVQAVAGSSTDPLGTTVGNLKNPAGAMPCRKLDEIIMECSTYGRMGCALAWWFLAGQRGEGLEACAQKVFDDWVSSQVAKLQGPPVRAQGATFPLRDGELVEFVEAFQRLDFADVTSCESVCRWGVPAWMFLVFINLNALAGYRGLPHGRWSESERRAAGSVRRAVESRCQREDYSLIPSEMAWQKDLCGKQVSYTGEEVSICHELTWDQVLPSLPPEQHGACIETLDWVGPQTRRFLLNPELLLKRHEDVILPKLPGKVHVRGVDKLRIAHELVRRNICTWVPEDKVYHCKGVPVLNGLFGVTKPTNLDDGRPVLRLIMNLTGSNSTQEQIEGGCASLPNINSWQSLVIDTGEEVRLFQSDMSSAFYLFRLPACWHGHLCFNLGIQGDAINGDPSKLFYLACNVIPMGWLNSVGIMQEISENLMKFGNLDPRGQILRGRPLPLWMSNVLGDAESQDMAWWHVYLDNFCAGDKVTPNKPHDCGRLCHAAAEEAWNSAGVVSSSKKRVVAEKRVTELGAELDGHNKTLGLSVEKLVKICQGTLWLVKQRFLSKKWLQIMAGRWVFALQFRRPMMASLQNVWHFIGGSVKITPGLKQKVKAELLQLVFLSGLCHCYVGAGISKVMIATDASERGGAVGVARSLSTAGADFLESAVTVQKLGEQAAPILLLSLFNGIGGCFRCYDVAGMLPQARIAVEINASANRVVSRRWPGTIIVEDVRSIDRAMVRSWVRQFLQIQEVHIWSGFPCTDLSAVKHNRENLKGAASSLFWEVPRVTKLIEAEFGEHVTVKEVCENVASMDRAAADEISEELGMVPYYLDCSQAVPMRRPRLCWSTEQLEGLLPDVRIIPRKHWKEVQAFADYPDTSQWITPGYFWEGEHKGAIFPTCMKAIPRERPPPRPAGLEKCDSLTKARWTEDNFRYPPYQYGPNFIITTDDTWRLLNAEEKELLLGYGFEHTKLAWPASKIKGNKTGFSDCRHSFLGDSFSVFSFVILAVACSRKYLPNMTYKHLVQRMGLAPGFRATIRHKAPLCRGLQYGSDMREISDEKNTVERLNRLLLLRTNHTGSDIRISSGEILHAKVFPRQSASAKWWRWSGGFSTRWRQKAHINVLEMEAILLGIKYQIAKFKVVDMRIFQLSDSYVSMSVVSKGRSSSQQLNRVMRAISAHLLAHGLALVMGHVESTENPTDAASRA